MPLTDYVNLFPAPEATGGYNTGGLGLTEDDLRKLQATYDYQTAANTIGQMTPFEQYQAWLKSQQPGTVQLNNLSGVQVAPGVSGVVSPINISAAGTSGGMPSNPFAGPIPLGGLAGAGLNAIYNLGSAGINALGNIGTNQVALGNLPAGNVGFETGFNPTYPDLTKAGVTITNPADLSGNVTFDTGTPNVGGPLMGPTITTPGYTMGGAVGGGDIVGLPAFNVTDSRNQTTVNPSDMTGGVIPTDQAMLDMVRAARTPPVQLPPFGVSDTKNQVTVNQQDLGGSTVPWDQQYLDMIRAARTPPVQLPPFQTTESKTVTPPAVTQPPTKTTLPFDYTGDINKPFVGPVAPSTATTTQTTATTSTTVPTSTTDMGTAGGITYSPTAGQVAGGGTQRDFAKELAASTAALRANQPNLMGMYGSLYQNLLSQTAIPQYAQQATSQMETDAAKLARIQQGIMNPEDIRQAQQAAREAYAARGQVMGQGAIGAEILNREAIRQQREDAARAGYQASMGNVANAAQLQTGNIFQPIGNLVSGTFNPLGAYPQDVYSSNYNAQLARDIAAANNAAAIEAAKYGAQASKQAAITSAGTNLIGNLLTKSIFG